MRVLVTVPAGEAWRYSNGCCGGCCLGDRGLDCGEGGRRCSVGFSSMMGGSLWFDEMRISVFL